MAFPGGPDGGGPQQGGSYPNPQYSGGMKPGSLQSVPGLDLLLLLIIWLGLQKLLPMILLSAPEPGSPGDGARGELPIIPVLMVIGLHSLIMLGAIYFIIVKKHGLRLADLGIVFVPRTWVIRSVIFGTLAIPASGIVAQFLQALSKEPFENPQMDVFLAGGFSPAILITSLLVTGAIVPLVEEIAMRGVFYGWLRARLSVAASVAISSMVFAFLHGIPFLFPVFVLIGAMLALITEKSGSVLSATIAHAVFNIINIASFYWLVQQGVIQSGAG